MKIRTVLSLALCAALSLTLLTACGSGSSPTPSESQAPESQAPESQAPESQAPASEFADAETFELRLSHSMASTSFSQMIYTMFADTVREASEGTVDIEVFPGSTLVSDAEAYDAVLNGNVEFAQFQVSYISGIMPELTALEIPGIYAGSKYQALSEVVADELDAIFAKYGVKYICPFPFDVMVFVGKNCVSDPTSQLKGNRVRTSGAWSGTTVESWGAAPMSIPIGDVPTALERKTVDQVLTSWIATQGFKLYETGPHITLTQMQEILPGIIMNLDIWNAMSPAQQDAVMQGAEAFMTEGYDLMVSEKTAFLEQMEAEGVEVINTSAETDQFFYDAAWEVCDQLVAETELNDLGLQLIEALKDPALAPGA